MKAARLTVALPEDSSDDVMARKSEQANTTELQAPKSPVPRSSQRISRRSAAPLPPSTPAEIIQPALATARWLDDDDQVLSVPKSPPRMQHTRPTLAPGAPKKPQCGWKRRASEADLADELLQDANLMSRALDFCGGDPAVWSFDGLFPSVPGCPEPDCTFGLRPVHHREHYSHAAPGAHRVLRFTARC